MAFNEIIPDHTYASKVAARLVASVASAVKPSSSSSSSSSRSPNEQSRVKPPQVADGLFLLGTLYPVLVGLGMELPSVDREIGVALGDCLEQASEEIRHEPAGAVAYVMNKYFHEGSRDFAAAVSVYCKEFTARGEKEEFWVFNRLPRTVKQELEWTKQSFVSGSGPDIEKYTADMMAEFLRMYMCAMLSWLKAVGLLEESDEVLMPTGGTQGNLHRSYVFVQCLRLIVRQLHTEGPPAQGATMSQFPVQAEIYRCAHVVLGATGYGRLPWLLDMLLTQPCSSMLHSRMCSYWHIVRAPTGTGLLKFAEHYREVAACIAIANICSPSVHLMPIYDDKSGGSLYIDVIEHVRYYEQRTTIKKFIDARIGSGKSIVSNFCSVDGDYDDLHSAYCMLLMIAVVRLSGQVMEDTTPFPLTLESTNFVPSVDTKRIRKQTRSMDVRPEYIPRGFMVVGGLMAGLEQDLKLLKQYCTGEKTSPTRMNLSHDIHEYLMWVHTEAKRGKQRPGGRFKQSAVQFAWDEERMYAPDVDAKDRPVAFYLLPAELQTIVNRINRVLSLLHGVPMSELDLLCTHKGGWPQEMHADTFLNGAGCLFGLYDVTHRPTEFLNSTLSDLKKLPRNPGDVGSQEVADAAYLAESKCLGPGTGDHVSSGKTQPGDVLCSRTNHFHRGCGNIDGLENRYTVFTSFRSKGNDVYTDESVIYAHQVLKDLRPSAAVRDKLNLGQSVATFKELLTSLDIPF
jgi:hypothetical protein